MWINSKLLIPLLLLFLSSCFSSRNTTGPDPETVIIDPVKTRLDTTTLRESNIPAEGMKDSLKNEFSATDSSATKIQEPLPDNAFPLAKDSLLNETEIPCPDEVPAATDTITIIGTGDVMPGTNYPDESYLPPDCGQLFKPVEDILKNAHVTFGNLEGVFNSGKGTPKKCKNPEFCYVFSMPDSYLDCILNAEYNLLSVANNHVNDFGLTGRENTAMLLSQSGVQFAGFVNKPSVNFQIDGISYGFAAFAPNTGTANFKNYAGAVEIVKELEKTCDIVIVSFHSGAEGKDFQHVPCTDETYLGYNRGNVCKFAHMVIDAGADIVFGHGPHVTRALELYNNRLICYSLGNFCTYARFNLRGPNGIAPIVKVSVDKKGEFLEGKIYSIQQSGEGGPVIDPSERALMKIRELSEADFPESPLIFNKNGKFYRK
ncbi:MAG: CapA family protein [Bacteroidales bacterium]|nr:CapA family protein [Bacteroidales bacterium]